MVSYVDGIPSEDFQQTYHFKDGKLPSVDDHFAFFKRVCDYASEYYLVQKAKNVYGTTKHSFRPLENLLNKVENGAQEALDYTAPIYENYVFPTTNRLFTTCSKSVENTKTIAVRTSTVTIGLAVVGTEMTLTAGALMTRLLLDALSKIKDRSENAFLSAVSAEKYVEQSIRNAINVTFDLIKSPSAKFGEHANTFLDIANSVFESLLSLPLASEDPESTVSQRINFLAARIIRGISNATNRKVVEPCQMQFANVIEQLQKSLIVVDYLKETQAWTFQKVDNITATTNELRAWLENEAKQIFSKPEDALIRYIHEMSKALMHSVAELRESGELVFNEKVQKHVHEAVDYITKFSATLQNADDLYTANSEVVDEAKKRLFQLTQWYKQKSQNQPQ